MFGGRGGQADDEGIEVVEHLPPAGVDAAVAFVHHDHVKGLRRVGGAVDHREGLFHGRSLGLKGALLLGFRVKLRFSLEHGVKPLNGGDDHLAGVPDGVGGEPLDVVKLGELAVVVGGAVALELLLGLLAQVGAVHQEQHPSRTAELD